MFANAGVGTGPPKTEDAPNPTSSVMISKIFGAPSGASIAVGKYGVEFATVKPIWPKNGDSRDGSEDPLEVVLWFIEDFPGENRVTD